MKLFSWLKKAGEIPKRETPVPGQAWALKSDNDDPFPDADYLPVKILDVKQGWVRYYMGRLFPDNRKTIEDFLRLYRRV